MVSPAFAEGFGVAGPAFWLTGITPRNCGRQARVASSSWCQPGRAGAQNHQKVAEFRWSTPVAPTVCRPAQAARDRVLYDAWVAMTRYPIRSVVWAGAIVLALVVSGGAGARPRPGRRVARARRSRRHDRSRLLRTVDPSVVRYFTSGLATSQGVVTAQSDRHPSASQRLGCRRGLRRVRPHQCARRARCVADSGRSAGLPSRAIAPRTPQPHRHRAACRLRRGDRHRGAEN